MQWLAELSVPIETERRHNGFKDLCIVHGLETSNNHLFSSGKVAIQRSRSAFAAIVLSRVSASNSYDLTGRAMLSLPIS
jgi:hypothetical protein